LVSFSEKPSLNYLHYIKYFQLLLVFYFYPVIISKK